MEGAVKTTFSFICWITSIKDFGAIILPMRHPVITKFFEKLFMVTVRSFIPSMDAKGTNSFSKLKAVYISSEITRRSCFFAVDASFFMFSMVRQLPLGFAGELIIIALVLLLMRLSRRPIFIWKSSFSKDGSSTGTPPASTTC